MRGIKLFLKNMMFKMIYIILKILDNIKLFNVDRNVYFMYFREL